MPARKPRTTQPVAPLPNQVCGYEIPSDETGGGGICNLPAGHDPADTGSGHAVVSPMRAAEQVTEAVKAVFDDNLYRRPVVAKLARIMGELPEIKPEGRNSHFNYPFIKDTQISGALRARMAREHLIVIPDVESEEFVEVPTQRGKSYLTKLWVRFTVIDADSGDSITGHGFGYGDDSGDKGANKAMTAAMKYWLIKLFQIGGEDLESDPQADVRAAERQAGVQETAHDVKITGQQIDGIERGGRSNKITNTQMTRISEAVRVLDLSPERFVEAIGFIMDTAIKAPEEGPIGPALNDYLKGLSGDDAGKLLSGLIDMKDQQDAQEEGAGGGYG